MISPVEAILGKITGVAARGGERFGVSFVPACLLPERTAVPEWLRGAVLTVEREAPDPRELGGPGDSFVLTPEESARWLFPLTVSPEVSRGRLPEKLEIALAWWPEAPAGFTVRVGRRKIEGAFAQRDGRYVATVETDRLCSARCKLPATVTVAFGRLAIRSAVLPEHEPCVVRLYLPGREIIRLENAWYGIDLVRRAGGAILAWRERARGIDHFARPEHRIGLPLETAGHADRFRTRWETPERLMKAVMSGQAWREPCSSRVLLAGRIDKSLATQVECVLFDNLPLLFWRRTFEVRKVPRRKTNELQEPIDGVRSIGVSTRGAWVAERRGDTGSRLLCAYDDHLVSLRGTQVDRRDGCQEWRVEDGWALAEHPDRRACSLYLFPPHPAPTLYLGTGLSSITLEPEWPMQPARAGDVVTLPLAMTAGECCGADPAGAWVGCRCLVPEGVRCAVVARLRAEEPGTALFRLGGEQREVPLQLLSLPEIGAVAWAVADFPAGRPDAPLEIAAAGIPQRRPA